MRQLGAVIWALLTTVEVRMALAGIAFSFMLLPFQDWPEWPTSRYINQLSRPDVRPFFRPWSQINTAAGIWPHYDWQDIQSEIRKYGPEQALEISQSTAAFPFLPRSTAFRGKPEPGQPEHLYEVLPELNRLSLYGTVVTVKDWQDIGKLQNLWWLEVGDVSFPEGDTAVDSAAASEAISALPKLRHLNVTGNSWLRLGSLPQLESLALDASRLETLLANVDLAQLPRLKHIYLRLSEDFVPTASQSELLQKLSAGGIERVELWTGRAGQRGWLMRQVDELRRRVPGLDIRSGEAGFGIAAMFGAFLLLMTVLQLGMTFVYLLILPQHGILPGFDRLSISLPICHVAFSAITGAAFGIVVEIRWWPAALLCTLFAGLGYCLAACTLRFPKVSFIFRAIPAVIAASLYAIGSATNRIMTQSLLGDIPLFNISILFLSAASTTLAIAYGRRLHVIASESPQSISPLWVRNGYASSTRASNEQQFVGTRAASLEATASVSADFADRLRSVNRLMTSGIARKNGMGILLAMSLMAFNFLIFFKSPFGPGLSKSTILSFSLILPIFLGLWMLMMYVSAWMLRTRRMASDFLFPGTRQDFWMQMRTAVLRDLRWPFLLSLALMFGFTSLDTSANAVVWYQRLIHCVFLIGHFFACCAEILLLCVLSNSLRRLQSSIKGVIAGFTIGCVTAALLLLMSATILASPLNEPVIWYCCAAAAIAGPVLWLALPKLMRNMELPG